MIFGGVNNIYYQYLLACQTSGKDYRDPQISTVIILGVFADEDGLSWAPGLMSTYDMKTFKANLTKLITQSEDNFMNAVLSGNSRYSGIFSLVMLKGNDYKKLPNWLFSRIF